VLAWTIIFSSATVCSAGSLSSVDLIERSEDFDGQIVTYEGEVVGDVMRRRDFAWVNVHDGKNAIGLWMRSSDALKIKHKGGYKHSGDRVRVRGVFNRACSQHGGDLDSC
jgi:hypothetical protein